MEQQPPTPARSLPDPPERPIPPSTDFAGRPVFSIDVGPKITLSLSQLSTAMVGTVVLVCLISWGILLVVAPDRGWSVLPAGAVAAGAQILGLLVLRPWKARHLGRWPMAWLAARGASSAGLLILGALVYSATRPDPLAFGLTAVGAYFASLLAEVAAYAADVRATTAPPQT